MTSIVVGYVQVESNRWIGLALEENNDQLITCTTPMNSSSEARRLIENSLQRLHRSNDRRKTVSSGGVRDIAQRLLQLFHGKGDEFQLKEIALSGWSPARIRISELLLQVPRGKVISYGALAKQAQSSARGVGSVMASNPVPLAVPCHRVIHNNGRLGKFGRSHEGSQVKAKILQAEGVEFQAEKTVKPRFLINSVR